MQTDGLKKSCGRRCGVEANANNAPEAVPFRSVLAVIVGSGGAADCHRIGCWAGEEAEAGGRVSWATPNPI
jgi:hypothetical protein